MRRAKATLNSYLQELGYKSLPFPAKYKGGKCGISGLRICVGDQVVFFRDFGLCLNPVVTRYLNGERFDQGQVGR